MANQRLLIVRVLSGSASTRCRETKGERKAETKRETKGENGEKNDDTRKRRLVPDLVPALATVEILTANRRVVVHLERMSRQRDVNDPGSINSVSTVSSDFCFPLLFLFVHLTGSCLR